jgi:cyclomaltodextrinase
MNLHSFRSLVALVILGPGSVACLPAKVAPNNSLPRPVPVIEHIVDTTTTVNLSRHLPGLSGFKVEKAPDGLEVDTRGTSLVISGSTKGFGLLSITALESKPALDLVVRSVNRPKVSFKFRPTGAATAVSVVGAFNGWAAGRNPLEKQSDGSFTATLSLDAGTYDYKFVVDGKWIADPGNPAKKPDGFEGFNSILTVLGDGPAAGRLVQSSMGRHKGVLAVDSLTSGPAPKIDPDSVMVLQGNQSHKNFTVADNTISLDLRQDGQLEAVRVYARDTDGRDLLPAEFVHGSQPTWRDEVMYFVFTDRFRDGDPSNNRPIKHADLAPAANYMGGDYDGLRLSIEEGYFKKLGVTAIWISPPQRQPEAAWKDAIPPNRMYTGYHGYWPTAAREVNPHFGTTESLHKMVAAAHSNGIKVIMDCVANHVHVDHPYYKQNPQWFGQYDLPDGRKNLRMFDEFPLTTWFDTFLPKFDYAKNPDAVAAVVDDMAWWVETFKFDGLRHDATKHIPHEFWVALTERMRTIEKARGAAIYQVGESIAGRDVIMDYVNAAEMDGQFDFPLYWPIRGVFAAQNEGFGSLTRAIADNRRLYGGFSIHSAFVGNHDFSRFMAFASGSVPPGGDNEKEVAWANPPKQPTDAKLYDQLRLAHTFVMTQPDQVPLVYYGDEFGLTGAGDPDNRRKMLFGKDVPPPGKSVMEHVGKLTALRKQHGALRSGDTTVLAEDEQHMVIFRSTFTERLIVALNRSATKASIPARVPAWALRGPSGTPTPAKMVLGDKGATIQADEGPGQFVINLPPRSSAIFLLP